MRFRYRFFSYQAIVCLILTIALIATSFMSRNSVFDGYFSMVMMTAVSVVATIFFFARAATVQISVEESGISITLNQRAIREIKWDEIHAVVENIEPKSPVFDTVTIHYGKRKKLVVDKSIDSYSNFKSELSRYKSIGVAS